MNNLAEEKPSIMKVCHSNQLLKMLKGQKTHFNHLHYQTPKTLNKSLHKETKPVYSYKISNYTNRISPVNALFKSL
ncbi:MAG: hypothetical protein COB02_13870 [Candidatus Cloacimonadota bacterium]|nr:MAG: hypothetical protein COB02_13870 [Candidatus Cloacimonadota bacterium]